jgi:hypothetical protein
MPDARSAARRRWIALAAIALPCTSALAANTDNWQVGDGDWNTPSNWDSGGVPGNGDTVNIGLSNTTSFAVTYDYTGSAVTLNALTLNATNIGGTVSATLSMSSSALTALTENVGDSGAASDGSGTFNQDGGTNTIGSGNSSVVLYLGYNATDTGIYNLGGNASLEASGGEYIGSVGTGIFNQTGGSNTISGGNALVLGFGVRSSGTYTLDASGSLSTNGNEYVAYGGVGNFNQAGGSNTTGGLLLGLFGGSGAYNLTGGALSADGNEYLGVGGTGTFNHAGGTNTLASGSTLYVGYSSNSAGTYSLAPAASLSANDQIVGYLGNGVFNQSGGTNTVITGVNQFSSGGELDIGYSNGSTGTYALSGGTLTVNGNAYVGGSSSGAGGSGTMTISNTGQLTVTGSLQVDASGQVNLNRGSATIGNLAIAAGGNVNVNSYLLINYGSGADPEGAIQQFIETGAITSAFVSANPEYGIAYADGGDPGLENSNLSFGYAVIEPALLGDADLDGQVNIHDLQDLLSNFNAPGFWDQGNFNGHALVDISDLQALLTNFNSSTTLSYSELAGIENLVGEFGDVAVPNSDGTGFMLVAAPEPASFGVMVAAAAAIGWRRRRRGRWSSGRSVWRRT